MICCFSSLHPSGQWGEPGSRDVMQQQRSLTVISEGFETSDQSNGKKYALKHRWLDPRFQMVFAPVGSIHNVCSRSTMGNDALTCTIQEHGRGRDTQENTRGGEGFHKVMKHLCCHRSEAYFSCARNTPDPRPWLTINFHHDLTPVTTCPLIHCHWISCNPDPQHHLASHSLSKSARACSP